MSVIKFLQKTFYRRITNHTTVNLKIAKRSIQIQPNSDRSTEQTLINPLQHEDYFGVRKLVTVEDLFNARVHYGHKEGCRNQNMQPYIFGCRNGVDVINLDETLEHLFQALNFLSHVVYADGIILFIMHSHIYGHAVEKMARECGEYALTRTYYRHYFLTPDRHAAKLPSLCVFLSLLNNVNQQHSCISDCAKVNIPTMGIADTNSDPCLVTYPVPGNDDSLLSIELYLRLFETCVKNAKQKKKDDTAHAVDSIEKIQ
ncbi:small ribosomal subunit protein uS2m-like [Styela clava]